MKMVCFEKRPIMPCERAITQEEIDALFLREMHEHHDRNEVIRTMQYLVDTGKWHGNFVLPAMTE